MLRTLLILSALLFITGTSYSKPSKDKEVEKKVEGKKDKSTIKYSTTPIGSPWLRHYAHRYNQDLKMLIKFEKRGFGKSEIITLVEISSHTGIGLKKYGKRRLKNNVTLRELAKEAKLEYKPLYKKARRIKEEIDALGDKNLPDPVYAEIKDKKKAKKKKKKKKEKLESTHEESN